MRSHLGALLTADSPVCSAIVGEVLRADSSGKTRPCVPCVSGHPVVMLRTDD